jgi:hypothetical protein
MDKISVSPIGNRWIRLTFSSSLASRRKQKAEQMWRDTERKKEADRELTQTTATTKVHKLTKPSLSFAISMFLSNLFGLCFGFFFWFP